MNSMVGRFPAWECTKWHSALAGLVPGQPGVFEVNRVDTFDSEAGVDAAPRRFSYFNGVTWGPVMPTPEAAYKYRLNHADSAVAATIRWFRGLSKEQ